MAVAIKLKLDLSIDLVVNFIDTINKNVTCPGQSIKLQAIESNYENTTKKTESPSTRICQSNRNSSEIPDRYSPNGQRPRSATETPNPRNKPSANTEKTGF